VWKGVPSQTGNGFEEGLSGKIEFGALNMAFFWCILARYLQLNLKTCYYARFKTFADVHYIYKKYAAPAASLIN